jgi:hypothetical protein
MRSQVICVIGLMVWCSFAAASTSPIPKAKPTSCRASDFAFDQLKSRHQHGHVYIAGRVVNNCNLETGVQIKISILDPTGGILRFSDFWPASTENIPPHSGFSFQAEMEGNDLFDRFQVTVIDVKRWSE